MLKNRVAILAFLLWIAAVACVREDQDERWTNEISTGQSQLRKGFGGTNGDTDYCNNPAAPCVSGEGDCDGDAQCLGALLCGIDNGSQFGFSALLDVCVPAHCTNNIRDLDETSVDCGGADCGVICSGCTTVPNGDDGHCSNDCPCPAGEGDCDNNAQCETGLVCGINNGAQFGFASVIDMCVQPSCTNGLLDPGETEVDCGGACGPICNNCVAQPPNGDPSHCSAACPCFPREGDCDSNAQCVPGSACVADIGDVFGFTPSTDMCLADYCADSVQNFDETGIDCGPSCLPCAGEPLFVGRFGLTNHELPAKVGVDRDGNMIVVGRFLGTTNLGGANLTRAGASPTAGDIYVAKYSPAGAHIWSQRFGAQFSDGDRGLDVAVGPSGQVAVAGNYYLTPDFGGGPLPSAGGADAFVMMLESNGTFRWARRFGGTGEDTVGAVTIDLGGNVVAVGHFEDTVDFGSGNRTSLGLTDIFVVRLAGATGATLRSATFGSAGQDRGYAVDTDVNRRPYIAGSFTATVAFGSAVQLVSQGREDAYVVRLTTTLVPDRGTRIGGVWEDAATGVAVDDAYRVAVTGWFKQTVNFGGGPVASNGGLDVFVLGLDGALGYRWATTFGSNANEQGHDIGVDKASGRLAAAGVMRGTIADFPGGAAVVSGSADGYFLTLEQDGTLLTASQDGGTGLDVSFGVGVGPGVAAYTGYFENTASIAGTSLVSAGLRDMFLVRTGF